MVRLLLTAVLVIPLLFSCGSKDARTRLVVYSPHGRDILQEFEEAFEKAHADVDVVTVYLSATGVFDRIRAERENPQAAVWWGGPSTDFDIATREGLLDPYRPSYAGDDLPHDPAWSWSAAFHLPIVIGYQPERIAVADLPKTWDDLIDPRFRGKVVLRDPREAGTLRTFIGAMILRAIARGGTEDDGFAFLRALHDNIDSYSASPEFMFDALEKGPPCLTVWNLTDLVFQRQVRGYKFLPQGLDEPVPVLIDGIALVKGAAARPEARAFYEFVNTLDAMRLLAERHGRIPARSDFDRGLLSEPVRAVPYQPMALDLPRLATELPSWMRRFDRDVRGRRGG